MKTKEQIFEEVVTPNGGGTLREKVYQAMQLYSDQQNKDMGGTRPDHIDPLKNAAWHAVRQFRQLSVDEQMQYFINSGILHGRSDQIQRLTKEVEELKSTHLKLSDHNLEYALENIRLRKLLGRASQYIQVYGMGGDTAKQLLTDIDNTLNPKPMSEAEKKWEEWDNEFTSLEGPTPAKCYKYSREAYKSALRREIEKRKKHLTEMLRVHPKGSDVWAANENRLRELQIFEDSLDTVEP